MMASITGCLHSRQPMPAVVQPFCTHSCVGWSEYIWCNGHTGQLAGLPGSERRTRGGSVCLVRTLAVSDAGCLRRKRELAEVVGSCCPCVAGTHSASMRSV